MRLRITCPFLLLVLFIYSGPLVSTAIGADAPFKRYADPAKRFTFEYPGTMKVEARDPDNVKVSHPGASLRITVVVEKRQRKRDATVEPFLAAFKKTLEKDMSQTTILEEGKLPGPSGSQGYVICAFKDQRGTRFVQLVQYCVSEGSLLQMTISDRPEGFKNLEKVIRKIHQSLKIEKL